MPAVSQYDETADAAYLEFSDATFDHMERLDDQRAVDFAADGTVIGVEILSPARGVDLAGLPHAAEIERVLRARGFRRIRHRSSA
jgi:uncharacterized protein YuzE